MKFPSRWFALVLVAGLFATAGCDESDSTSLRLEFSEDLSGIIRSRTLQVDSGGSPLAEASPGVTWTEAARVVASNGTFASLNQKPLRIADIEIGISDAAVGNYRHLTVVLPRGSAARWPGLIAPEGAEALATTRKSVDPEGKTNGLGEKIKIFLDLPKAAAAQVIPEEQGAELKFDKDEGTVSLTVDVASARAAPEGASYELIVQVPR